MAMLDGPVFVVTTQADGQPSGCLISFATQTSVRPPSFMVGLPVTSQTCEVASRAGHLAVHALPQDRQVLAELFGGQTRDHSRAARGGPAPKGCRFSTMPSPGSSGGR